MLKPGGQPFVMERIPVFKNIKIEDAKRWGLNIFKRKKDKFGRYIQNFADYEQPLVAASYCKEQIYNVHHPVCQECNRRCFWK